MTQTTEKESNEAEMLSSVISSWLMSELRKKPNRNHRINLKSLVSLLNI